MAAKRLGQFLSNVTGTAGQILRVKADESGFEMFTPAGLPTYTITNDTTDRVIDADVTTADELADVLATLIKDITTLVGGPVAFQWSSSEQLYPIEKAADGSALFCKQINFGSGPADNNYKDVALNIAGFVASKVHSVSVLGLGGGGDLVPVPFHSGSGCFWQIPNNSNFRISAQGGGLGWSSYTLTVRLIYAK